MACCILLFSGNIQGTSRVAESLLATFGGCVLFCWYNYVVNNLWYIQPS
jgi:hypothetical protein